MSKKQDANEIQNAEASYEHFKDFGENARKEYEKLYDGMFSNLSVCHLQPFATILLEKENIVLKDQNNLVEGIRANLAYQMKDALHNFWNSNNISEALITLEMCKEKFKAFKGHKWEIYKKTPIERTRPIRMRFKENRLRYLNAQLKYQNQQMESSMLESMYARNRIQEINQQRAILLEKMSKCLRNIELAKPEILKLEKVLLNGIEDENHKLS